MSIRRCFVPFSSLVSLIILMVEGISDSFPSCLYYGLVEAYFIITNPILSFVIRTKKEAEEKQN